MLEQIKKLIESHMKTHSDRSAEDAAAVATLEFYFRSNSRINSNFTKHDKWPNTDGTFEFVADPEERKRPTQNFFTQIKGTHNYKESNGIIKYSLRSLAFPAFIAMDVTLDPGILFVVLNPDIRGSERVFWKYISVEFINSVDFNKDSATIEFSADEEILNSDESILAFCKQLESIIAHHSFVNKLSTNDLSKSEIIKIIKACDTHITEAIEFMFINGLTRDDVSQRIIPRLYDLCRAALLLNSLGLNGSNHTNLQLAWEEAMLNVKTKYLATFLKGLNYIDGKIPDIGQSERIMLKYYSFLWQIRDFLKKEYDISILHNLEKFPLNTDKLDKEYYQLVASAMNAIDLTSREMGVSRFYIVKKTPFYVGKDRYYEVTLQLAGVYATKYNRITAYTKENLTTNYSVRIGYVNTSIDLWGVKSNIKVITSWVVSIEPSCLNKFSKILKKPTTLSANYGEYNAFMSFLTKSGISLLDLIDLKELSFSEIIESIFKNVKTTYFKEILIYLNRYYSNTSTRFGRNTVRYLLLNLKEETLLNVLPWSESSKKLTDNLYLSSKCFPFETNPFLSNLAGSNTSNENNLRNIVDIAGNVNLDIVRPYLKIQKLIQQTGEIFFDIESIANVEEIEKYNAHLDSW